MKHTLIPILALLCPIAAFAQAQPASRSMSAIVNCISKPGGRQECAADTSAGVALIRSTGEAACLLGKNWGYDSNGVWVSDGCGGEFATGSSKEIRAGNEFLGMFEPYGQLRAHLAAFNDDAEVQDNASRIGINFATRGKIKIFAGTEWGVNLVQSDNQFNLGGSSTAGFGALDTVRTPIFSARLGFVGADFGPFGKTAIGKQNAVHYDIASYTTDRFNVFGGQGSMAYVAGTDGGMTGTGRADRVVNYRNQFLKILEVGAQAQFRGDDTGHTTDGYGLSTQVTVLPGVKLGGAYTRTYFSPRAQAEIRNLRANAEYMALGARVDWKFLEFGATFAQQHSGDLVQLPTRDPLIYLPVVYGADGVELYGRARFGPFALVGGFIKQSPDVKDRLLHPDFHTNYFIIGGEWYIAKSAFAYTEAKLDNGSRTATGDPGYSVFTVGLRYDFSWRTSHQR